MKSGDTYTVTNPLRTDTLPLHRTRVERKNSDTKKQIKVRMADPGSAFRQLAPYYSRRVNQDVTLPQLADSYQSLNSLRISRNEGTLSPIALSSAYYQELTRSLSSTMNSNGRMSGMNSTLRPIIGFSLKRGFRQRCRSSSLGNAHSSYEPKCLWHVCSRG